MPRFKAVPKRGYAALQESESRSDDFSSDEMSDTLSTIEGKTRRERMLCKLISIAQKYVGKLVNVSAGSVRNLDTAIFLAQAAALASGSITPSSQTAHLPITPLGLSLEDLPIPQHREAAWEQTTLEKVSTATQTANQCKPEPAVRLPAANSTVSTSAQTEESGSPKDIQVSKERRDFIFDRIPLAPPGYDPQNPLGKRKNPDVAECSVCHKMMRRGSLREHMEMHYKSGKFKCDVCQKTFSRASAREKHVRTHTGEKPFVCEYCSKAYRQRVHLNEHMRSHTGIRPFVCRLCGFSLASKSLLNRHLGTHGVDLQLPDAPDLWFKSDAPKETVLSLAAEAGRVLSVVSREADNEILNGNSVRTSPGSTAKEHTEATKTPISKDMLLFGRKHLCSACPAGFPTVQALRSHRLTTHGVQFPHNCPECKESFTSIKSRKVHLRVHHPQVCSICSKVMPQRKLHYLHAHIRQEHPDSELAKIIGPPSARSSARALRSSSKRSSTMSEEDALRKWKHFKEGDLGSSDADDESACSSSHSSSLSESDSRTPVEPETANPRSTGSPPAEASVDICNAPERSNTPDTVSTKTVGGAANNSVMSEQVPLIADIDPNKVIRNDNPTKLALLEDRLSGVTNPAAVDPVISDNTDDVIRVKHETVTVKKESP